MTLKHVRPFAKLVTDWCLKQDDLAGFHIHLVEDDDQPYLWLGLDWSSGCATSKEFSLHEIEKFRITGVTVTILESFAAEARKRAARVGDPGRLPG
jgi:hypothetical protein